MNSIQTPSVPGEKKRFLFPFLLLCSLAFTSVAFGGVDMISFNWPDTFHPYTNDPGSAALEAKWIVYPNGLPGNPPGLDFYLTATTPHQVNGGEILFRYGYNFPPYFGLFPYYYKSLNDPTMAPYLNTEFLFGENRQTMRYRLFNTRTAGQVRPIDLVCTNQATTIAAGSNGVTLPQSTIYVNANYIFPFSGKIQVITSTGSPTISYTGTFSAGIGTTAFTGCTGGSGTLTTGNAVAKVSGNKSSATHFQNTVYLFNFENFAWDVWYDNQFDQTAMLHDCTACGGTCGFWGPLFENNYCGYGVFPPIGVLDTKVSIEGGSFVQGNGTNLSFYNNPYACGANPFHSTVSYIQNYQWIIKSPDPQ
jgi:hypothetical protein